MLVFILAYAGHVLVVEHELNSNPNATAKKITLKMLLCVLFILKLF